MKVLNFMGWGFRIGGRTYTGCGFDDLGAGCGGLCSISGHFS